MSFRVIPVVTADRCQPSQATGSSVHQSSSAVFIMPSGAVPIPSVIHKRRMKASDHPGVPTGAQRSTSEVFNTLYRKTMHKRHGSAPSNEDYPLYTELANSIKDNIREFLYNTMKLSRDEEKYSSTKLKYADKFRELKRILTARYSILAAAQNHWVEAYFIKEVMQRDRKAQAEAAKRTPKKNKWASERNGTGAAPTAAPIASTTGSDAVNAACDNRLTASVAYTTISGAPSPTRSRAPSALPFVDSVGDSNHLRCNSAGNENDEDSIPASPTQRLCSPGNRRANINTHSVREGSDEEVNGLYGSGNRDLEVGAERSNANRDRRHFPNQDTSRCMERSSARTSKRANVCIGEGENDSKPHRRTGSSSARVNDDLQLDPRRNFVREKGHRKRKATEVPVSSEGEDSESESDGEQHVRHKKVARVSRTSLKERSKFRAPRTMRK